MKQLKIIILVATLLAVSSASADACEKCLAAEKANVSSVSFWLTRWERGENSLQVSLSSIAADYGMYDVAGFIGGK